MSTPHLTLTLLVDQSPERVYDAINNVRGWWSGDTDSIEGNSTQLNDEFIYRHGDMHRSTQKVIELAPDKKVVWLVTDSYLSFIKKYDEWTGTKVIFDITEKDGKTQLHFTHEGLTPDVECFEACTGGWSHYLKGPFLQLLAAETPTTQEVATQFYELAQQEKWFEIQDLFFADNVQSIEPATAIHLGNAAGKTNVREKGMNWVKKIEAVHSASTTEPIVAEHFFTVGRKMDITVKGIGRIQVDQIMLYEVREGQIVLEQFFY